MPILLKTQVDRTAKTPVTARRARVGGSCDFPCAAERVPTGSRKIGRCADVRGRCGNGKRRRKPPVDGFRRRKEPQAARQEKRLGAFLRQPVHVCPQCGQFWAIKKALFCEGEKWIGADFRKKPRSCRCCRHYFGAFHFWRGVNAIKAEEKRRHSVWLDDATWSKVQYHYKLDGCTTQNDFIAKAILFYCGYLQSEYAGDFLPKILGETLEAILSMFGDRIGKLLLKQAVEQNVCNHILASDTDIDAQTYQQMRGKSYQEVLRTNGQISFPEVLRQKSRW